MTRSKNKRLRIIPSHLPLIRDKLADYAQYRLGELGSQTQYEAMMTNAWSMTDQIRTAQLWWVSRDMTRLAEDTVQAGDFPKPDPPTQCGMVFFDGDVRHISFHLDDDGFGETRIAAILWQDVGRGDVKISVFTDNPVGIREMHADLFGLPVVGLAPSVVREGDGSFQWVCGLLYAVWALSGEPRICHPSRPRRARGTRCRRASSRRSARSRCWCCERICIVQVKAPTMTNKCDASIRIGSSCAASGGIRRMARSIPCAAASGSRHSSRARPTSR